MKEELLLYLNAEMYELGAGIVFASFAAALILGLLIFAAYKFCYSGTSYNGRFNVSLVMMCLITTLVMSVIGNNVALSLGMVGALSIVRFRTAIKDPRDTTYIFWCIAVGICCGVQSFLIAFIGSIFIFVAMLILSAVKSDDTYLLIIEVPLENMEKLEKEILLYYSQQAKLSVQNVGEINCEYIYELSEKSVLKADQLNSLKIAEHCLKKFKINRLSIVRQSDDMTK